MNLSTEKPVLFQNNRCPSPWPSLSPEGVQEQLPRNGISCRQLLGLRGLRHYSQLLLAPFIKALVQSSNRCDLGYF